MFGVPKQIAHKMVKKEILSCKLPLSTFTNLIFRMLQQKNFQKRRKTQNKIQHFGSKTPKNDLLTLIYSLSSSFTTLRS